MPKDPGETFRHYADRILSVRAPGLKFSVPTCVDELGIETSTAKLHDASQDAYVTHLIFLALEGGDQPTPPGDP